MICLLRSPWRLCVLALLLLAVTGCTPESVAITPLEPAPQQAVSDGERLGYVLVEATRELGRGTLATRRTSNGWVLEQRYEAPGGGGDASTVTVNEALRPLTSSREVRGPGESDGTYALEYRAAEQRFASTVTRSSGIETREFQLRENAYDNESSFWLWRSLPLDEGYVARYVSVNAYERSQQTVELRVIGKVQVTVPAGTFEAWRLQVLNGRATRTAWIEVAPPHRLVQWDNGHSLLQLVGPATP